MARVLIHGIKHYFTTQRPLCLLTLQHVALEGVGTIRRSSRCPLSPARDGARAPEPAGSKQTVPEAPTGLIIDRAGPVRPAIPDQSEKVSEFHLGSSGVSIGVPCTRVKLSSLEATTLPVQ